MLFINVFIGIPDIQELHPIWNEIQLTDLNSEYTDDSGDNDEYYDSTPWKVESEKTE